MVGCSLRGLLPRIHAPSLKNLAFAGNFTGHLPEQWGELVLLTSISITGPNGTVCTTLTGGMIPPSWCNLQNLRQLDLLVDPLTPIEVPLCLRERRDLQLQVYRRPNPSRTLR
eukprot:NODE_15035_length_431_cov_21.464286_g14735_i0.p1 GENE.NODE_15035_length_431_cov_21.464286_g14735_i0~~NODE_15035_length_431_cov_21.464286_g14735_i0.p1  ORF type:complete len:113 (+),score=10.30 NODE_15035_length_431_cov_21.464286_g14735_i0:89-427(+)